MEMDQKERQKILEEKKRTSRESWNIRPYLAIGLTAFIVIAASISFYFVVERYNAASATFTTIMKILAPIIYGVVLAYLLNPLVNFAESNLKKWFKAKWPDKGLDKKLPRPLAVVFAMLVLVLVIALFISLIVPSLASTIEGLIKTLPDQIKAAETKTEYFLTHNNLISQYGQEYMESFSDWATNWVKSDLLPQSQGILSSLTSGVIGAVKGVVNLIIGIIVCVYVLMDKQHFNGMLKKLVYGIFPVKAGNAILKTARQADVYFSGFIAGKIIDSIIIGILTYIVLIIFRMPYSVLISVIVGVTNVVPVFGPYIGAIPSFLLVLLEDPKKSLYFLIIILVIQQLDGNIIGPKILGESTGLSSFWVMFAILLGGGLFGFVGMLFGVPTFATIYYIVNEILKNLLDRKHLPVNSDDFVMVEGFDPDTHEARERVIVERSSVKEKKKKSKEKKKE